MKVKSFIFVIALALCAPVFADDAQEATADEPKKTPEEVAAQVESQGEALTETRNTVELLNRLKITGYIQAQFVHVFVGGRIIESGGPELADELDANGYERFTEKASAEA